VWCYPRVVGEIVRSIRLDPIVPCSCLVSIAVGRLRDPFYWSPASPYTLRRAWGTNQVGCNLGFLALGFGLHRLRIVPDLICLVTGG
jgi:hypothetical protein